MFLFNICLLSVLFIILFYENIMLHINKNLNIDIRDNLLELTNDDLKELYKEEFLEAKQILQEIRDLVYKLAK